MDEKEALQARIADLTQWTTKLNAEIARLRTIEAAAQEARACLEGRRPGFNPAYVARLLRTALDGADNDVESGNVPDKAPELPIVRGGGSARVGRRRRSENGAP